MDNTQHIADEIERILYYEKGYRRTDMSAGKVAEAVGVAPSQLSRILKKEFKMSYSDYVNKLRVEEAQLYLSSPRFIPYHIDEIGALVGFSTRQAVYCAFKKFVGMGPEQWRKVGLKKEWEMEYFPIRRKKKK